MQLQKLHKQEYAPSYITTLIECHLQESAYAPVTAQHSGRIPVMRKTDTISC